jgi:hypothetical protein
VIISPVLSALESLIGNLQHLSLSMLICAGAVPSLNFGGRNAAARVHKNNWRRSDMAACCPRAAGSGYAAHRHPVVCTENLIRID